MSVGEGDKQPQAGRDRLARHHRREWTRIGCIGFGGPPTHIALLRRLCVEERHWLPAREFEDGIAATNLLPGPASTQLAIFCAWRLRGAAGAVVGGFCFILPGLLLILALSAVFLASHPPAWIVGAAAGAGAARAGGGPAGRLRSHAGELAARRHARVGNGRAGSSTPCSAPARPRRLGPYLVLVLVACGLAEIVVRQRGRPVVAALGPRHRPRRRGARPGGRRHRSARLGGLQGRRPLLRRRLRHRARSCSTTP